MNDYKKTLLSVNKKAKLSHDKDKSLTLCQHKEIIVRKLGFQNLFELQTLIKYAEKKQSSKALALKEQCLTKEVHETNQMYYDFSMIKTEYQSYSYEGKWVGWDEKGNDVRIATLVDAKERLEILRGSCNLNVYVIVDVECLQNWRFSWGGRALIAPELIEKDPIFRNALIIAANVSPTKIPDHVLKNTKRWLSLCS